MPKRNKTIVTGGAGFIGSHLVNELVKRKRKVVVVDDLSSGKLENLYGLGLKKTDFEFRKIDLTDFGDTLKALQDGEIVYHLAARIGGIKFLHGNESAEFLALSENLAIDSNVFRACENNKVKKIIYTSSSAVYPLERQFSFGTVFSEKDLDIKLKIKNQRLKISIDPDGGYGLAKILAEIQLLLMKNVKVGIARIFNVYGINEPQDERSHAITDLIKKAIFYPKRKFVVWGDGRQTRDYLYVTDCVEALIKMEEKISKISPLILNIGSGKATSIREIAKKIIKISGKKIKPIYDKTKPVGPLSRTADISEAKKLLNWVPKVKIEEGLEKTYSWIQKNLTK
jgi:nucleoside-diphosphate-sugar epimerase